jgi:hypothetical protein
VGRFSLIESVEILEGLKPLPGCSAEERVQSYLLIWQGLIDSRAAWSFSERYARQAESLIDLGSCRPPPGERSTSGG